jgi:hypothetical protein
MGNSSDKFAQIDRYVHERLAIFNSKKRGRSGRRADLPESPPTSRLLHTDAPRDRAPTPLPVP